MKRPIYRALASTLEALRNCEERGNAEWQERHRATIKRIMYSAPSGSGIDCGTSLDWDKSGPKRLEFSLSYHHMDDNGYYDGWTEHTIVVTPAFDGIDIRITGRDRNDIKDYLADVYHEWLTGEYDDAPPSVDVDGQMTEAEERKRLEAIDKSQRFWEERNS